MPLCRDADEWLGGISQFEPALFGDGVSDICVREFVFKIDPRGSYTIQYTCEDGHTEPVNCYGYSALKTAWASWKWKFDAEVRKKDLGETFADFQYRQHTQFFTEDNGWSMHDGSVCAMVWMAGAEFLQLHVCTSGAKSSEDKECSLAGISEAQKWFEAHFASVGFDPYIDDMKEPLEQIWQNG